MYTSNEEVVDILKKTEAIISDSHFVYTSGKHAKLYVNKDYIFPHIKYISRIAEIIAQKYKDSPIDVVAGPSMGGIILSQWTAYHLGLLKNKEILSVYTEKQPDKDLFGETGLKIRDYILKQLFPDTLLPQRYQYIAAYQTAISYNINNIKDEEITLAKLNYYEDLEKLENSKRIQLSQVNANF